MSNRKKQHKVLVLLGSPRKNGNSAILAREIAVGAESVGASVESLFIQGMNIKACQACWSCQKPDSKGCAIKDDMQEIFPKLIEADSWVIATPVHWLICQLKPSFGWIGVLPYPNMETTRSTKKLLLPSLMVMLTHTRREL